MATLLRLRRAAADVATIRRRTEGFESELRQFGNFNSRSIAWNRGSSRSGSRFGSPLS
jgi:hypothetical protein